MALSRVKTWGTEVLTSSDLNAEFNNIINNALSLVSPWTGDMAAGGNKLTGLSLGTEGSPSLQFTGDTNTGIFSSAADTLDFATGGAARFQVNSSGHLLAVDDATYDIGASGATRPRDLYLSRSAVFGTGLTISGLTANAFLYSGTAGLLTTTAAPTNGQLLIGSTGAAPVRAALAADTGITVTNGAGTITLAPTFVVKSADETVNNSTTLQNDDHLLFALAASTNYFIEVFLLLSPASVTPDWKFSWTVPASCTMFWGSAGVQTATDTFTPNYWVPSASGGTPFPLLAETATLVIGSSSGGTHGLALWGIVRNSTNTGNLQLQWAQNTANASDSKVLKDSFMRITKLQ